MTYTISYGMTFVIYILNFVRSTLRIKFKKKRFQIILALYTKIILNLLNPIIPFVTEEISRKLNYSDSSLFNEKLDYKIFNFKKEKKDIIEFEKMILFVKTLRSEYDENDIKKIKFINFFKFKN